MGLIVFQTLFNHRLVLLIFCKWVNEYKLVGGHVLWLGVHLLWRVWLNFGLLPSLVLILLKFCWIGFEPRSAKTKTRETVIFWKMLVSVNIKSNTLIFYHSLNRTIIVFIWGIKHFILWCTSGIIIIYVKKNILADISTTFLTSGKIETSNMKCD